MTLDKLGIVASIGCLIHCMLVPVIIPLLPILGLTNNHGGEFHLWMVLVVGVIGFPAVIIGVGKHEDPRPIMGFSLGFLNLGFAGLCELYHLVPEGMVVIMTILGSIAIIGSHWWNHTLSCKCMGKHSCH